MKKQIRAVILLLVLGAMLFGIVELRAEAVDQTLLASSVYTERCEKIHWVADALRSLRFENGNDVQKAALKQCGDYWHEQNDLRKQALAKEEAEKPKMTFWKTCTITAYEWTGEKCANGNYPTVGYTVACNSLPLGTKVYIEGIGYRTVEDRGATWHSDNWMDLYLGDTASCNAWGIQYRNVYLVK